MIRKSQEMEDKSVWISCWIIVQEGYNKCEEII